jgi:hypothetical protein
MHSAMQMPSRPAPYLKKSPERLQKERGQRTKQLPERTALRPYPVLPGSRPIGSHQQSLCLIITVWRV